MLSDVNTDADSSNSTKILEVRKIQSLRVFLHPAGRQHKKAIFPQGFGEKRRATQVWTSCFIVSVQTHGSWSFLFTLGKDTASGGRQEVTSSHQKWRLTADVGVSTRGKGLHHVTFDIDVLHCLRTWLPWSLDHNKLSI